MTENARFELLRKLAQESRRHPELLLKTARGYSIYGAYQLLPHLGQVLVIDAGRRVTRFSTMKSALRYCTAMKQEDYPSAQYILLLDQQLSRAQTDIELHMTRIQQWDHVELHQAKLSAAHALRTSAEIQLSKYPTIAKYLQTKRIYQDETHRSRTHQQQP